MNSARTFLAQVNPFRELPSAELDRLAGIAREVRHKKGETIFSEGDEAGSIWILKEGRLEILKYTSEGKTRAIEVINPKDLYGTLCRLGAANRTYPCTAIAATDSISYCVPDSVFFEYFRTYGSVLSGVCALCSNRLASMQELTCTTQEPVEKRIVKTLLRLFETHGAALPYTKREISELAATTVETTIRTLSDFQKKDWISSSRGKIVIKDKPKLESLV